MKHQKEWYTCDRCGEQIKESETKRLYKRPFRIGIKFIDACNNSNEKCIDLCKKCSRDFERFVKNE